MFYSSTTKKNRVISTKIVTSLKEKAFLQAFCVGNKMKLSFIINKMSKKVHLFKIWGGKIIKGDIKFLFCLDNSILWNGSH